jgi:ATP synthase proteolipid subunit
MSGIIAVYGLVVSVLIAGDRACASCRARAPLTCGAVDPANPYAAAAGFVHLGAGLACGLTGLSAGYAIGRVGDSVRAVRGRGGGADGARSACVRTCTRAACLCRWCSSSSSRRCWGSTGLSSTPLLGTADADDVHAG